MDNKSSWPRKDAAEPTDKACNIAPSADPMRDNVFKVMKLTRERDTQANFIKQIKHQIEDAKKGMYSTVNAEGINYVPGMLAYFWNEGHVEGATGDNFNPGGYEMIINIIVMMAEARLQALNDELSRWTVIEPQSN